MKFSMCSPINNSLCFLRTTTGSEKCLNDMSWLQFKNSLKETNKI